LHSDTILIVVSEILVWLNTYHLTAWWNDGGKWCKLDVYPSTFKAYSRIVPPPPKKFVCSRLCGTETGVFKVTSSKAFILFIMLPLFVLAWTWLLLVDIRAQFSHGASFIVCAWLHLWTLFLLFPLANVNVILQFTEYMQVISRQMLLCSATSIDMLLFWMHCALWMTFRLICCVNYAEVYPGHTTTKFIIIISRLLKSWQTQP